MDPKTLSNENTQTPEEATDATPSTGAAPVESADTNMKDPGEKPKARTNNKKSDAAKLKELRAELKALKEDFETQTQECVELGQQVEFANNKAAIYHEKCKTLEAKLTEQANNHTAVLNTLKDGLGQLLQTAHLMQVIQSR